MITIPIVQLAVLLIITIVYAAFDVFNKRNIPDLIVYATIVVGIIIALLYNYGMITLDFELALAVGVIGFVVYRAGFLGEGDVLELVFISLVLPVQDSLNYSGLNQLGIPFVLSVIVGAGYTATIFVPLYYILFKKIMHGKSLMKPHKRSMTLGGLLLVAYIIVVIMFYERSSLGLVAIGLILFLALAFSISLVFKLDIENEMTNMIYPSKLEPGDMIALNLMDQKDIAYFKKRYSGFGRLCTNMMIKKIKSVKKRLPVYRDSVPFSLFILFGVIISLVFGNLILVIIGI